MEVVHSDLETLQTCREVKLENPSSRSDLVDVAVLRSKGSLSELLDQPSGTTQSSVLRTQPDPIPTLSISVSSRPQLLFPHHYFLLLPLPWISPKESISHTFLKPRQSLESSIRVHFVVPRVLDLVDQLVELLLLSPARGIRVD